MNRRKLSKMRCDVRLDCPRDIPASEPTVFTECLLSRSGRQRSVRAGQSLVEFAVVALAMYLLLAAILTFGHLLFVAQGLQSATDTAARELSRELLPPEIDFVGALDDPDVKANIYDPDYLVFDLNTLGPGQNFFTDVVPNWPTVNRQLAPLMIADQPDLDGDGTPDLNLIRYPGALVTSTTSPTGYSVEIPIVVGRGANGVESIRWVKVVEEIQSNNVSAFSIASPQRGIVALRLNYPYQSAAMSSFRRAPGGIFDPNVSEVNVADDGSVTESNSPEGTPVGGTPVKGMAYPGTYAGRYGLGVQGALGSDTMTGGLPVRPFRRVITTQAIYRREVFGE